MKDLFSIKHADLNVMIIDETSEVIYQELVFSGQKKVLINLIDSSTFKVFNSKKLGDRTSKQYKLILTQEEFDDLN